MESGPSSCLLNRRQRREVELIRGLGAERGVRAARVVELDEAPQPLPGIADRVVGTQVHLLVLDRAPQPLHEDVVSPGATPVHADGHAALLERIRERQAGELATLVGVEDLGLAVSRKGLFQRLQAERRVHADRDPVCWFGRAALSMMVAPMMAPRPLAKLCSGLARRVELAAPARIVLRAARALR